MCGPVVVASRCEILIGQRQAAALDCPCDTRHVYIHALTFPAAACHCVCETPGFEECIGLHSVHSR